MSKPNNDGGPAFPLFAPPSETGDNILPIQFGMTLRDWFAGHSLTGLISMQANPSVGTKTPVPEFYLARDRDAFAKVAYDIADAMLAARNAQGGQIL